VLFSIHRFRPEISRIMAKSPNDFQPEQRAAISHLQAPMPSCYTTFTMPQRPYISPMESFDYTTISVTPHGGFHPRISLEPPTVHMNGNIISPGSISVQDPMSYPQNNASIWARQSASINNPSLIQLQSDKSKTRKRAPKAPTMLAERWEASRHRIKHLYVHEGKTFKDLREIINKEFGFTAT
jgi:hypothetical protein